MTGDRDRIERAAVIFAGLEPIWMPPEPPRHVEDRAASERRGASVQTRVVSRIRGPRR
jgi:hypothetical protein